MVRSSGLPTGKMVSGITRIIRSRTSPKTVSRPTVTTNALDEETETLTEHTESMWLFEPRERIGDEIAGERIEGNLGALLVADGAVDIGHGDRITRGGVEYEVDTVVGYPEDGAADGTPTQGTKFWMVDMVRRQ